MKGRGRALFILTYLAPAALLYGMFVLWPLIQAFVLSLFQWRGYSANKTFVGADNFKQLAGDAVFKQSLWHNLEILVLGGLAILAIAIALAHALGLPGRLASAMRGLFLFPHVISLVAVSILWKFIFDPTRGGLFNGVTGKQVDWLGQRGTALPAVGCSFVWYAVGFYVMLFMAGLRQIPAEVNEAAELDGAKHWNRFSKVTWPMLWSIKRIAVIYLAISVFNIFALVKLMTDGGPDRATETMLSYLYKTAFTESRFGYGTAVAVVNFVVVMAIAGIVVIGFRRDPQESH